MRRSALVVVLGVVLGCGGDDDGGTAHDAAPDEETDGAPDGETDAATGTVVIIRTYVADALTPSLFAAAQDGDGPWQLLDSDDGVYMFDAPSGRYGFVHFCGDDDNPSLSFFYSTVAEHARMNRGCTGGISNTGSIQPSITGFGADTQATITIADSTFIMNGMSPDPTIIGLATGSFDAFAAVQSTGDDIDELMIVRDIEVTQGSTTGTSINLGNAIAATTYSLIDVVGNEPGESASGSFGFMTANGTEGAVARGSMPTTYAALPTSEVMPNELYTINIQTTDLTEGTTRQVRRFQHTPQDVNINLPPFFAATSVTTATTDPVVLARFTIDLRPTGRLYDAKLQQNVPKREILWTATRGWIGEDETTYTWEQPDLTGLVGWQNIWALEDDVEAVHSMSEMTGDTADPIQWLANYPDHTLTRPRATWSGDRITRSTTTGNFTP